MNKWRQELGLFFIAMGFFTRIPIPAWVSFELDKLNKASRYFGLVGILIGAICAAVYCLFSTFLPISVSLVLTMISGVVVTGGFHEDGLADTADGLGGGWLLADKLRIMKDSSIGTYGALALFFALMLKFALLFELALLGPQVVVLALVLGHCLSRIMAASMIFTETYVRDADSSKVKPLAQDQSMNELMILLVTALAVLLLAGSSIASDAALSLGSNLVLVAGLLALRWLMARFFRGQIGGYTGDTLGAVQQVSELACYALVFIAFTVS